MASQITGVSILRSAVCSGADQIKYQCTASLVFVWGIHWWPVFAVLSTLQLLNVPLHDDVIKWKHFPRNWPFVWGIHRSPVNSPHKGKWVGALMFSLICVWINDWVNNREGGDLIRYRAHYEVIVMDLAWPWNRESVVVLVTWDRILSLARIKLRLCSVNHRAGYFSNLVCDWLSTVRTYSRQKTKLGHGLHILGSLPTRFKCFGVLFCLLWNVLY